MRWMPARIFPMWASVTTKPMVPWMHMYSVETLLKKITPQQQSGSLGSQRSAPTIASCPRGSLQTALRNQSCSSRKIRARSASGPLPKSGAPEPTIRVGSPSVWESMTCKFAWSMCCYVLP